MKNLITILLTLTLLISCNTNKKDDSGMLLLGLLTASAINTGLFRLNLTNAQALGVGNSSTGLSTGSSARSLPSNNLYSIQPGGVITSGVSEGSGTFRVEKVYPGKNSVYLSLIGVRIAGGRQTFCPLAKAESDGYVSCVDPDLRRILPLPSSLNRVDPKNNDPIQVDTNDGVYYYGEKVFGSPLLYYATSSGVITTIELPPTDLQYYYITSGQEKIVSHVQKSDSVRYLSVFSGNNRIDLSNLSTNTWIFQRANGKYLVNPGLEAFVDDVIKEYDPSNNSVINKIEASGIPNYDTFNTASFAGRLQDIRKILEIGGVTYFFSDHESCHTGHLRRQLGNLYRYTGDTTLEWLGIGSDNNNQTIKSIELIEAVGVNKVLVWGYTTVTTNGTEGATITQTKSDSNLSLILFDVITRSSTTLATYTGDSIKISKIEYSPGLNIAYLTAIDTNTNKSITGRVELSNNAVSFTRTVELNQVAPIK
ncbi:MULTISPECIES: hypothetical protein [Leptospira]|uniref:hypothetical protein n=1 Tax=Leptospira TaxID=171 RepID=UPI0010912717|nr:MULTISPECIES: hypothetical protein [Leptospira]TGL99671.1 hypothetical protein EHQ79_18010 [Leptospira jelokensis]TGM80501.1 hypothetical protein EHQ99_12590 [Leptospira bouyouniensis]